MTTRAKFRCDRFSTVEYGHGTLQYEYIFYPVTSGSEENKSFWEYTPAGELRMVTSKKLYFEPGKEYYLDFISA